MASCKDCLHNKVCINFSSFNDDLKMICPEFIDRNRFVELPCKVGNTVYFVDNQEIISYQLDDIVMFLESEKDGICFALLEDFNKTVFLTRELAEKALKERENNG